jgi:hypothetical protein
LTVLGSTSVSHVALDVPQVSSTLVLAGRPVPETVIGVP